MKQTIFLLLFLLISGFVSAQKYTAAYAKGNYEKALSLAQKAIDKDSKNLDAYLIKALSNLHLASDPETEAENKAGVESALSTLDFIIKKDKQHVFITQHASAYDSIMDAAYSKAESYYENEKNDRAGKLLEKLISIRPAPEFFFLQGRMLMDAGETVGALQLYNEAAAKIYTDDIKGIKPDPEYAEIYIELANGLYDEYEIPSANITYNRALKLFDDPAVEKEYYDALFREYEALNEYTDHEIAEGMINNLDTVEHIVRDKNKFNELKWEFINKYYTGLVKRGNDFLADSLITLYSCAEGHDVKPMLLEKIIRETRVVNPETNPELTDAHEQIFTLAKLMQCDQPTAQDIAIILPFVDSLLGANNYSNASKLLYDVKLAGADAKKIALYEDKIFQKIKILNDSTLSSIDLFELTQFFPANKNFKSLQKNSAVNTIAKLIEDKKFSRAGEMLRTQLNTYPKDATLISLYKQWVIQDYLVNYMGSNVWDKGFTWNGSTENCKAGKLSEQEQKLFLQRLNYVRRLAGVPDQCELNETWNRKCMEAALMMTANGSLSHNPPDTWKCFSQEGHEGASNSNLSLGASSTDALMGQIDDDGSNNTAVGHRRWILDPERKVYGHGSTTDAMALWALGGQNSDYPDSIVNKYQTKFVVWPPQYICPADFYSYRWSFSLWYADFSKTTVEVFMGDEKMNITVLPEQSGYGESTLVWEMNDLDWTKLSGSTFTVHVNNVSVYRWDNKISEGVYEKHDYVYSTTFIPIGR